MFLRDIQAKIGMVGNYVLVSLPVELYLEKGGLQTSTGNPVSFLIANQKSWVPTLL